MTKKKPPTLTPEEQEFLDLMDTSVIPSIKGMRDLGLKLTEGQKQVLATYERRQARKASKRFEMRVAQSFLDKVDDWRRQQPDIPSRANAIRLLVE